MLISVRNPHVLHGGIAQLARAFGSYPKCRRFKSYFRYHIWPGGQAVKTPPFHGGNTSSILVRVTKYICRCGGIGRHKGLKIPRSLRPYRFKSGHRHQKTATRAVFFVLMGLPSATLAWYKQPPAMRVCIKSYTKKSPIVLQ